MLAGSVRSGEYPPGDIRLAMPRFNGENLRHNLALAERFITLADGLGLAPATLALSWVLGRAEHIVAIPGTRNPDHLEENVAAATVRLDPETVAEIDTIFAAGAIAGHRYSPALQAQIDTELLPEEMV